MLGHKISEAGIEVDQAKLTIIKQLTFSKISKLLCCLLEKDVKFEFTKESEEAFLVLKDKLSSAPIIVTPDWNLPFKIMADASDYAIGTVLGQRIEKVFYLIYYVSKLLNSAQ